MIVCLCEGVSDRRVAETIEAGASTVRDVGRQCGAGTHCGACHCDLKAMLRKAKAENGPRASAAGQLVHR